MNRATSQELYDESIDKLDILDRQVQPHSAKEMKLTQEALQLLSGNDSAVFGDTLGVDGPCSTSTQKLDQAEKMLRNVQQQRGSLEAAIDDDGYAEWSREYWKASWNTDYCDELQDQLSDLTDRILEDATGQLSKITDFTNRRHHLQHATRQLLLKRRDFEQSNLKEGTDVRNMNSALDQLRQLPAKRMRICALQRANLRTLYPLSPQCKPTLATNDDTDTDSDEEWNFAMCTSKAKQPTIDWAYSPVSSNSTLPPSPPQASPPRPTLKIPAPRAAGKSVKMDHSPEWNFDTPTDDELGAALSSDFGTTVLQHLDF
jgi:hypothetical protein